MKSGTLKIALPWLALALLLPLLALSFNPAPVEAGCGCNEPVTVSVVMDISPGGGEVEVEGQLLAEYPVTRTVESGELVSLEALPADGYYFVGWSGDLSGSENPTALEVTSDVEIVAHFFPAEFLSADGIVHVVIAEGTVPLGGDGELLTALEIGLNGTSLSPPSEADIVGFIYELGPTGASFDQPVSLSFSYDPTEIPPRVAEAELFMACYDQAAGQWQELPSTVDAANHVITAPVDHLSTFSVIAPLPPPLPAEFSASSLLISPRQVDIGEPVTVSVLVTNSGELEGSYSLTLELNGAEVETEELTMAGGSQRVSFSISGDEAGSYSVAVNGLEGSFTVQEPPFFPITLPGAVGWVLLGPALAALVLAAVILPLIWRHRFY